MSLKDQWAAKAEARNAKVLAAAMAEAGRVGYSKITRENVARSAGLSLGCVNLSFGTMAGLKDAVMAKAVQDGVAEIVAQGLADGNAIARNADPQLKDRALATLT